MQAVQLPMPSDGGHARLTQCKRRLISIYPRCLWRLRVQGRVSSTLQAPPVANTNLLGLQDHAAAHSVLPTEAPGNHTILLPADNWARGLHCELVSLGYQHQATSAMHPIEMATLRSLLAARRASAWAGLAVNPRTCSSEGARLCTHACWFQRLPGITTKLLQQPLTASVMRKFLLVRMGSHGLPGLTGGWAGIPRDARVCPLCQSLYLDERHAMLECRALQPLQDEFGCLFQHPMSMRQFMWRPNTVQLAEYVVACMRKLNTGTDA